MSRSAGWIVTVIIGAVIFVITLGSRVPINFVIGLVLAAAVTPLIRQFMVKSRLRETDAPSPPLWLRLVWLPVFLVMVFKEVVIGTRDVLLYTIGIRSFENAGIIRVPIGERTASGVAITAWALTLSPGSAYVDTDLEEREMLIHVLEADDGDQIRVAYQNFYDRYQRRIFP